MAAHSTQRISQLLLDWGRGDESTLNQLLPLVYDELRRLARHYLRGERRGHTLQTTALFNEAYLRLVDQKEVRWQSRTHFYAVAAQMIRHILVDHTRTQKRAKRGGEARQVTLEDVAALVPERSLELIALDEALTSLSKIDLRKSRVVELRYIGGLSNEGIAGVLKVSPNTVMRDWTMAQAWLRQKIRSGDEA